MRFGETELALALDRVRSSQKFTFSKEIIEKVKTHISIDKADFYVQQITGNTLKSLLVNRSLKT